MKATIEERLQVFEPTHLEVIDDSDQHIGHAGSKSGGKHYTVIISAKSFNGLNRIEAHRKIYAALSDLIPHPIHALRIKVLT